MKNQETGEFELVMGNRQLLSGFFIVVILFGVFFTMGYIVGRNSAPSARVATAAEAANAAAVPSQVESRPQPAAGTFAPPAQTPAQNPPAASETGAAAAPASPAAAQTASVQPAAASETPAPVKAPEALPNGLIEPAPGDVYLQVMAVKRPDAELVMKTLRDKGFRAVMGAGPNELVRVLVGPFPDSGTLGQAKASLENAGFHPYVRK